MFHCRAMAVFALDGRMRMRVSARIEHGLMTGPAVFLSSVFDLLPVLNTKAQKLHTGLVRVVALGTFKAEVMSLRVDARDPRPSACRVLQFGMTSQAERPCRVDHKLWRVGRMLPVSYTHLTLPTIYSV